MPSAEDRPLVAGRLAPLLAAAAYVALGFLALWMPWVLGGRPGGNPIDGMSLGSPVLLFGVGFLVGSVWPGAPLWLAFLSMAVFAARIPIDLTRDPTSHNLFPIELGFYALLSGVAAVGAWLGRRRARSRPPSAE